MTAIGAGLVGSGADAQPQPGAKEAAAEWRGFVESLAPIGERTVPLMTEPGNPQLRQELYKLLVSEIGMAYFAQFLGDEDHPDFWPLLNQAFNVWGPTPDYYYYHAPIDGNGTYKLVGYRGTVHIVDFQIGPGDLYNNGTTPPVGSTMNYDADELQMDKNGYFEVLLSAKKPEGYTGNWWQIYPDTSNVHVRQISYDWLNEVDARFTIERLDKPAARPRLTAEQIKTKLARIGNYVENMTVHALKQISEERARVGINKVGLTDYANTGGTKAQRYVYGQYDLQPDEALILETTVPNCRYWGFVLNDLNYSVLDYTNRHASVNGFQARLDKDGKFRAVISEKDPGVPNWLDTIGYGKGAILGRWRSCDSSPLPSAIKVKVADVRKYLPSDTPVVTPEQRDEIIRLRARGAKMRRRW